MEQVVITEESSPITMCGSPQAWEVELTQGLLNKMEDILQTAFLIDVSWKKMFRIFIKISLKFVPEGPIDDQSALVQVMAWCWISTKPLP